MTEEALLKLDICGDKYSEFLLWKQKLENYNVISELSKKTPEYQVSMSKSYLSDETPRIGISRNNLDIPAADKKNNPKAIVESLEEYA